MNIKIEQRILSLMALHIEEVSGYCSNLETLKVLVETIPSANLTFPCIFQSDNLKSSQNFGNPSIIKNFGFLAIVFCSVHKNDNSEFF